MECQTVSAKPSENSPDSVGQERSIGSPVVDSLTGCLPGNVVEEDRREQSGGIMQLEAALQLVKGSVRSEQGPRLWSTALWLDWK